MSLYSFHPIFTSLLLEENFLYGKLCNLTTTPTSMLFQISLKMDEKELEEALQDKTLMSSILQRGAA